jgi:hypothetical protein
MWKEADVATLKVIFQQFPEGTEINHEKTVRIAYYRAEI